MRVDLLKGSDVKKMSATEISLRYIYIGAVIHNQKYHTVVLGNESGGIRFVSGQGTYTTQETLEKLLLYVVNEHVAELHVFENEQDLFHWMAK